MSWQLDLGSIRVISISDGHMTVDPGEFIPRWDATAAGPYEADADGRIRNEIGCFLLEGPGSLTLVDTGGGPAETAPPRWDASGRLLAELDSLGIAPADVARIIHTHLHRDHWGGDLTADGHAAFPEAEILLLGVELDAWRDDDIVAPFMRLVEEGRVGALPGETTVGAGMTVLPTAGHTPGHASVLVDGGTHQAVILGDAAHHPAQLNHPDWSVRFDRDPDLAADTRAALFDRIERNDEILMGGHWPGAGWGRIRLGDAGRTFVPL